MRIVVALAVALAGSACNGGATASGDGVTIFQSTCAACHGPTGKPPDQMIQRLGVRDLTAPEFRARVTRELVEKQIRYGSANKLMPAFGGALRDDQIESVADYVVKTFKATK